MGRQLCFLPLKKLCRYASCRHRSRLHHWRLCCRGCWRRCDSWPQLVRGPVRRLHVLLLPCRRSIQGTPCLCQLSLQMCSPNLLLSWLLRLLLLLQLGHPLAQRGRELACASWCDLRSRRSSEGRARRRRFGRSRRGSKGCQHLRGHLRCSYWRGLCQTGSPRQAGKCAYSRQPLGSCWAALCPYSRACFRLLLLTLLLLVESSRASGR